MKALFTGTFREEDPADLAGRLRVMAAAIPPDAMITVALTPIAARRTARAIEAGVLAMDVAGRMVPPQVEAPSDAVPRFNILGNLIVAAAIAFFGLGWILWGLS